jgi:hypothetical protein
MSEGTAETVELDAERFVLLVFSRDWPKYIVSWTLRQRAGEGDFPLGSGAVSSLPPRDGEDLDTLWERLRQEALDGANAQAAEAAMAAPVAPQRRSLLARLFGK